MILGPLYTIIADRFLPHISDSLAGMGSTEGIL